MQDPSLPALVLPDADITRKSPNRAKLILQVVILLLLSLAFAYGLGVFFGNDADFTGPDIILLVIGSSFAFFCAILLHELGHLLGGKLAGFRFVLLVAGPIKVTSSASGPKLSLNRSWTQAGAASYPTSSKNLRSGFLSMFAGGPITSLVTGTLLLLMYLVWKPAANENNVWHLLVLILCVASLVIGVGTLFPSDTNGLKSDGRWLLDLWRKVPTALAFNRLALLSASSLSGTRPRDWDAQQVAHLASFSAETNSSTPTIASFLYSRALDCGDLSEARVQLQRLLNTNHLRSQVVQSIALLNAAFFEAWVRKDLAQAERFMPKNPKDGLTEPQTRLVAQSAIALLRQEFTEAQALLDQAEAALEKTMDIGMAHLTRDQIATMRQMAKIS